MTLREGIVQQSTSSEFGDAIFVVKDATVHNNVLESGSTKPEKKSLDSELILAIRLPNGRRLVKEVLNQSQNLIEFITELSIETEERLDIDYLECLDAAASGSPKMFRPDEMKLPIRELQLQNKSLIIFQYSD